MKAISDFICDIDSARGNITLNTNIYSLEAISAATYQFTDSYHVLITTNTDNRVTVIFESKDGNANVNEDLKEFANSLIDHQIRIQLEKSNGKIRDLIVTHAFSPIDLSKVMKSR